MTPIGQTLLTLLCMICAWYWGYTQGKQMGVVNAIQYFKKKKYFRDGIDILEDFEEEEDE